MTDVTLRQFNAFLKEKAPEKPCPECGVTRWGVLSAPDSPPTGDELIFKGFMRVSGGSVGQEFYPVSCQNCGYTKFFSADIIESWVDDHG